MSDEMVNYRLEKLENAYVEVAESLKKLAEQGAQYKELHGSLNRAFSEIRRTREDYEKSCDEVDDRLRLIEQQFPILLMTSRWVIGGTIAIVAAAFSACGAILWLLWPLLIKSVGG